MRLLVLFAMLLPAALAGATSPSDPFEATLTLDRDPAVGVAVVLHARVQDNAVNMQHGDVLRLELPAWVIAREPLEWSPEWREGGVYERTWTLSATRVGFWAARLAFADPGETSIGVVGLPLRAWSDDGSGAWSQKAYEQVAPDGAVEASAETAIVGDTFVLTMQARGTREWMRHAEVYVQGNAMGVGDSGVGRGGETARMRLEFDVPIGTAATLAPNAGVRVRFDGGVFEASEEQGSLACLGFTAYRDESGPRWDEHGECRYPGRDLPVPAILPLAGLLVALAMARRQAPPAAS